MAPSDSYSEFKRGWYIVLIAALGLACGLGAIPIYSLGVFTKPLGDSFGWSRAEVQGIYTWMTIGNLIAAPVVGWLIDNKGVRQVTLVSILGMSLGFAALGLLTGPLWSFYVIAFFTAIIGVGTTPITYTRLIIDWFDISRGKALGITLAGTGVTATFLPSYASWLIETYDWRIAYLGLAALPALLAFPVSYLFLHDREKTEKAQTKIKTDMTKKEAVPEDSHEIMKEPIFREVLKDYKFWAMNISFMLVGVCIAGCISHLVPMLTDRNVAPREAAQIAGTIGVSVIVGRLGTGYLIDRFWAPGVALCILTLPAISCLILASGYGGIDGAVFAAILIGLAAGAEFDLMSFLVSKYFGQKKYGIIYSCLYAAFKISAGIGAPLFGYSFDVTGSYDIILYAASISLILGSLILLTLGPYRNIYK